MQSHETVQSSLNRAYLSHFTTFSLYF